MPSDPKVKKRKIVSIIVALIFGLAIGAAGYVAYKQYFTSDESIISNIIPKKTPKPNTTANPLDGTQSNKEFANRHPLAIIVENHPEARPQVGLEKASIIYEAISEGGITRFMAIYGPQDAENVGPVRSLRTFFLDWAEEYNAFIAHVGGNIDALDRVGPEGVLDLDQFALGVKAYWREAQAGVATEHTMYTSTKKLYDAAKTKGWEMTGNFTPLKFQNADEFEFSPISNTTLIIPFSSATYEVKYIYEPVKKVYLRYIAGISHKDRVSGNQLSATNIVIMSVSRTHTPTRINEESWTFDTVGQGEIKVFYGGKQINGVWKKTDKKSRTKFYESNGKEIQFLPGQFWIEVVPPDVFSKVKIDITENPSPNSS